MLLVVAVAALTISIGIYAYTKHIDGASKVGHDDSSSSSSSKQNHYHAMTDPIDGASAGMGAGMVGGGGGSSSVSSTTSVQGLYDAMSDKANTLIDTLTTGLENVGRHEIDDGMEGEVKESLIKDNNEQTNDTNNTRLLDSENEGSGI